MIEIRSRYDGSIVYTAENATNVRQAVEEAVRTGANLYRADLYRADLYRADLTWANLTKANLSKANLSWANLSGANLSGANLTGANLTGAYLTGANLTGANLSGAYLSGAYLTGANLSRANLSRARGLSPSLVNPLELLTIQTGKLRAWKLTGPDAKSRIHTTAKPLVYKVGKVVKAKANPDTSKDCGAGVNLATLAWVRQWYEVGNRVFLCEFDAASLVMPDFSDGKFRVSEALVVGELVL